MPNPSRLILLLGCIVWSVATVPPALAQPHALTDADLPPLLARLHANMASNAKLSQQYTSDELWHNRNFDKNGKTTLDESAKYENVFIEGLPYRKKVEVNGKPLAGKQAAAEEKRYAQAVSERRAMTTEQKRLSLHRTWHSSLPMCCLDTLFSNRILGYGQIDGRDMVIVESVPRADAKPANDEQRSALDWKQKSWIDLSDVIFARVEVEKVNDKGHTAKGSTVRIDFERLIDTPSGSAGTERAVWLLRQITLQFRFKMLFITANGTTEQTWSNYKRFHVDARLLEDTVTPVAEHSEGGASTTPRE